MSNNERTVLSPYFLGCCFIGHRKIDATEELKKNVRAVCLDLINKGVEVFYFGGGSQFDELCYDIVTELKQQYPEIQRVFVRADHHDLSIEDKNYLSQFWEDTFYPPDLEKSGRGVYVRRNQMMITASDYCVFYYDPNYTPSVLPDKKTAFTLSKKATPSGTKKAYEYAVSKKKTIINVFEKEIVYRVFLH